MSNLERSDVVWTEETEPRSDRLRLCKRNCASPRPPAPTCPPPGLPPIKTLPPSPRAGPVEGLSRSNRSNRCRVSLCLLVSAVGKLLYKKSCFKGHVYLLKPYLSKNVSLLLYLHYQSFSIGVLFYQSFSILH